MLIAHSIIVGVFVAAQCWSFISAVRVCRLYQASGINMRVCVSACVSPMRCVLQHFLRLDASKNDRIHYGD